MTNPLRVNPPTVGTHLHMARMIGHVHEEATERPLVGGQRGEPGQARREKPMRACCEGHAELGHQIEQPLQGNAAPDGVIHIAQRLEAQQRAPQIVPASAEQIGEEAGVPVQVKDFGLRFWVLHPLRAEEIAEGTFAGAGCAKNQEVPQVTHMVDHTEQRVVLGVDIKPRPRLEMRVVLWPRPGRREARRDMRQKERVLVDSMDVIETVAGLRGEPGSGRMLALCRGRKALVGEGLHHIAQLGFCRAWIGDPRP